MRKHHVKGGVFFLIGYILSPLSLWDDIFVNVPISYVLALIVQHFSPSSFLPSMILIYWLTNLIGFLCVRKGIAQMKSQTEETPKKQAFLKDFMASVAYTVVLVLLVQLDVLHISF